jgi:hypothetical protein
MIGPGQTVHINLSSGAGQEDGFISYEYETSQSHVMTDDQSVSNSWFQGPSGSHDQILLVSVPVV